MAGVRATVGPNDGDAVRRDQRLGLCRFQPVARVDGPAFELWRDHGAGRWTVDILEAGRWPSGRTDAGLACHSAGN